MASSVFKGLNHISILFYMGAVNIMHTSNVVCFVFNNTPVELEKISIIIVISDRYIISFEVSICFIDNNVNGQAFCSFAAL